MSDMYTEKVLDHFRNPRNMGKIKEPDGVGTVGNPTCLLPDTYIISNPKPIEINNIDLGEKVLSHDGKFHLISKKINREYNGNILAIKNRIGETFITPDHLVYAFKVPKTHTYCYNRNKRKLIDLLSWWHSKDLEKKDIIAYPIPKKIKDIKYLEIKQKKPKYDFKSVNIPSKIKINGETMRFFGYFIAEGSTRIQKCKTYTCLTFNIKEEEYIKDCAGLIEKIFDVKPSIEKKPYKNTTNILIYNTHLTRFLRKTFGKNAENKKMPNFFMFLPQKKQSELIKGLWRGDGHIDQKRYRASYSTISLQLCQQIKILLLRQGIVHSIYKEKSRFVDGVNHKKSYRIFILETISLKKLISILNIDFKFKEKSSCNSWIEKGFLFTPITEIKQIKYDGDVHNLEVENSHSYTTNSLSVHNCGDVMTIYIKVKNEKIYDIKFQTYGCAAAIASSSIATELVKGKTLQEAEKLTRDDVAKELGGLPAVKMHCSNLASDALKEAIKDYREKNKK